MGIYNEDGTLSDGHWMFVAARWAGSHYKLLRWDLMFFILIIVGAILWSIINN